METVISKGWAKGPDSATLWAISKRMSCCRSNQRSSGGDYNGITTVMKDITELQRSEKDDQKTNRDADTDTEAGAEAGSGTGNEDTGSIDIDPEAENEIYRGTNVMIALGEGTEAVVQICRLADTAAEALIAGTGLGRRVRTLNTTNNENRGLEEVAHPKYIAVKTEYQREGVNILQYTCKGYQDGVQCILIYPWQHLHAQIPV